MSDVNLAPYFLARISNYLLVLVWVTRFAKHFRFWAFILKKKRVWVLNYLKPMAQTWTKRKGRR